MCVCVRDGDEQNGTRTLTICLEAHSKDAVYGCTYPTVKSTKNATSHTHTQRITHYIWKMTITWKCYGCVVNLITIIKLRSVSTRLWQGDFDTTGNDGGPRHEAWKVNQYGEI
ncbi:hypothetical protein LSH36_280g03074 [Paralvinella palmiformis]|uniref:Uncharacterized protein n=1 Tax=Paralvinella palmiformis TaxID=53620 RepID=A0AAD9N266_9ANNE|nr:hypothetical protein LSH36_280g03074 [Paralvinella palmiformis]